MDDIDAATERLTPLLEIFAAHYAELVQRTERPLETAMFAAVLTLRNCDKALLDKYTGEEIKCFIVSCGQFGFQAENAQQDASKKNIN